MTDLAFSAREADHRVRNLLAIVCAAVANERRGACEGNASLRDALGRIEAQLSAIMVLAMREHEVPDDGSDGSFWADRLCAALDAAVVAPRGLTLAWTGSRPNLDATVAAIASRALCELVTNAARHAYDDLGGRIEIGAEGTDRSVRFWVRDWGRGGEAIPRERSGLALVGQLIASAGGDLDVRCSDGTIACFVLPRAGAPA